VAVSTSGQAPALSGFIKEDLEKIFGQDFAAFLDWLGELRERAKADEPDAEKRRQLLREALDGFHLHGKIQYPQVWLDERAKQQA
jgi:precorrin-2 dehydrogenase/sirohydrochlorin ferrochelatase